MVEICCSAGSDRIFRFGGLYHVLPAQYLPLTEDGNEFAFFCDLFLRQGILLLCGLKLRVWLREPATVLIAVSAAVGIFQLLLLTPKKWVKITAVILWAAAVIAGGAYGFLIYAFCHLEERTEIYDGKACVVEEESALWVEYDRYYEQHGLFFRGTNEIYTD